MNSILRIARKELLTFFSSLIAFIFFGSFLAVTLFTFFWADPFFARNIADVRPLFEWMPMLLIFLVSALTMRMWSEERRAGTLEFLLTVPVSNIELVLGKFFACMTLVLIAFALTLFIPICVAFIGPLDWGPVVGGYIAAFFLAASYTAIGLYVSSRTENQIVSLIISSLVCSLFLLIGTDDFTKLFSNNTAEILQLVGSGSRFQSITRGIIDLRDLYYYLSITGVFLSLNVLGLEKMRWAGNKPNRNHEAWTIVIGLCMANFIAANFWLQNLGDIARLDLTEGQIYSISGVTRQYLASLKEPLLIRGYFSKKNHPYLAPLVPRLRDILKEYQLAGNGKVRVEIVDPADNPDIEKEAGEKYGIKPATFQTASKYQAALTSSYFDILIKYGDQFEKLGFRDLIETKLLGERTLDVDLRNPEYDITRAIKKAINSYQSEGNPFLGIEQPVKFTAYISPDSLLPQQLLASKAILKNILESLSKESAGKFSFEFVDPEQEKGTAEKLASEFGFRPMLQDLNGSKPFWFSMVMKSASKKVSLSLALNPDKQLIESSVKAGLKRFSKAFIKTVGVWLPPYKTPLPPAFGKGDYNMEFRGLAQKLKDSYSVRDVSLKEGHVPGDVDVMLVLDPQDISDNEIFALDQFLMHGGTVIISSSPFDICIDRPLNCREVTPSIDKWLKHFGITQRPVMVLDPQNIPFPTPSERNINGYKVETSELHPYPFLVNVNKTGMSAEGQLITGGLGDVAVAWPSPINVDETINKDRRVLRLLSCSKDSWLTRNTNINPSYEVFKPYGFNVGNDPGQKLIGVAIEGTFDSYFKGKDSPIKVAKKEEEKEKAKEKTKKEDTKDQEKKADTELDEVIDKSLDTARIVLYSSNVFLSDKLLYIESVSGGSQYSKPLELIENTIDWSLQDRALLALRGRGHFARNLQGISPQTQVIFEYANYGFAIFGLIMIWLLRKIKQKNTRNKHMQLIKRMEAKNPIAEVS